MLTFTFLFVIYFSIWCILYYKPMEEIIEQVYKEEKINKAVVEPIKKEVIEETIYSYGITEELRNTVIGLNTSKVRRLAQIHGLSIRSNGKVMKKNELQEKLLEELCSPMSHEEAVKYLEGIC